MIRCSFAIKYFSPSICELSTLHRTVNLLIYNTSVLNRTSIMRYISLVPLMSGARPVPCDLHELAVLKVAISVY